MRVPVRLVPGRVRGHPQRDVLAAQVGRGGPRALALELITRDAVGHIDAPADVRVVGSPVRGLLPGARRPVVDAVGTGVDIEAHDIADQGGARRARIRAHVAPPHDLAARARQELREPGHIGVSVDLVGRIGACGVLEVDDVLDRLDPSRVVDQGLHGLGIEQPRRAVGVLGVGHGPVFKEVEAEAAPRVLERVDDAIGVEAGQRVLLAGEELGLLVDLLPRGGRCPLTGMAFGRPCVLEHLVRVVVGPIGEGMGVPVDGDPVRVAIPGADGLLEIVHVVVHVDLGGHPVGHRVEQPLAGRVALERGAHGEDVEGHRAGRDRLLQERVVVGLRQVDPTDIRARVLLPGGQEAAEQVVVETLVVESHERERDAGALAWLDVGLGGLQGQGTDLLPVGIRGAPGPRRVSRATLRGARQPGHPAPRRAGNRPSAQPPHRPPRDRAARRDGLGAPAWCARRTGTSSTLLLGSRACVDRQAQAGRDAGQHRRDRSRLSRDRFPRLACCASVARPGP